MPLDCARGDLEWIFRKISSLPRTVVEPPAMEGFKSLWMWPLGTWGALSDPTGISYLGTQ